MSPDLKKKIQTYLDAVERAVQHPSQLAPLTEALGILMQCAFIEGKQECLNTLIERLDAERSES